MNYINKQVIRFIVVGFINTFNYYMIYLFLNVLLKFNYLIAHVTAFVLSMIGSFFMNSYYTYKTKPTLKKFLQFPLTYVVNISVTTSAIYLLVNIMKMNQRISPLVASVVAIPFTFIISKKILVRDN